MNNKEVIMLEKLNRLGKSDRNKICIYLDFCKNNGLDETIKFKTSTHHILPIAVFPEYGDLTKNKWNACILSNENHFKAHALLFDAVDNISFASAWYAMLNKDGKRGIINIEEMSMEYSELIEKRNIIISQSLKGKEPWNKGLTKETDIRLLKQSKKTKNKIFTPEHKSNISKAQMNKVMAINIETGEKIRCSKEEFESNDLLRGINYNKVISRGKNNPAAKERSIVDADNNVMFEVHGNFKQICVTNKLPYSSLGASYKSGEGIHKSRPKSKFYGWKLIDKKERDDQERTN